MAVTIVKVTLPGTGNPRTIARLEDGSIATIDEAAAPASVTLTHDWRAQKSGVDVVTGQSPFSCAYDYRNFHGVKIIDIMDGASHVIVTVTFYVALVLGGSGHCRWEGTFSVKHQRIFAGTARVEATIRHFCAPGTVSPYGAYEVTGWLEENPYDGRWITILVGSSIVIS